MTDNQKYDLKNLIETFSNHAQEIGERREPDGFNFPRVILEMCLEIQSLKTQMEELSNDYYDYDP